MSHDTEWKPCVSSPQPTQQQVLEVVQQQSQALSVSARGKVGRPSELPWMQLCLGGGLLRVQPVEQPARPASRALL